MYSRHVLLEASFIERREASRSRRIMECAARTQHREETLDVECVEVRQILSRFLFELGCHLAVRWSEERSS